MLIFANAQYSRQAIHAYQQGLKDALPTLPHGHNLGHKAQDNIMVHDDLSCASNAVAWFLGVVLLPRAKVSAQKKAA